MKPIITPQMALYNDGDKIGPGQLRKLRAAQADPVTRAIMRRLRCALHLLGRAGVQAEERRDRAAKEAK